MATAPQSRGKGPERAWCRPLPTAGRVVLEPAEGHHLVRARRVRVGEEVALFDGEGEGRRARVVAAGAEGVEVEIVGPSVARRPWRSVVVATAWPDGARADGLIATLAELGVEAVVPLRTGRTNVDPADRIGARTARQGRIAIEAAKVNGSDRCLRLEAPLDLGAALRAAVPRVVVLLDTAPGLPSLADALADVPADVPAGADPDLPGGVCLLVGPEGGFTDDEVALATKAGARVASLGGLALRTETAAIAAASIALGSGAVGSGRLGSGPPVA